jgi:glucokinase
MFFSRDRFAVLGRCSNGAAAMQSGKLGLLGDVGATNARFALLFPDGSMTAPKTCAVADFASLAEAIEAYLAKEGRARPTDGALAVAAPIVSDAVSMINHPWSFSIAALGDRLGIGRLSVFNDFVANALAIPHLAADDVAKIGAGQPAVGASIGVLGPGSGLGVSGLIRSEGREVAVQGEGGHVTLAPANLRESAVLDQLRARFGHVSAERVLSGPGLVNLYGALCELSGQAAPVLTPAEITEPSRLGEDPHAREAVTMFCAMLGTIAGNLALTLGARGGVYIAGGIAPRLEPAVFGPPFRERFEDKGRLRPYLASTPTYLILRPTPALLGMAARLKRDFE